VDVAQHQLEIEIISTRDEIARLKHRLTGTFERPSEFVAVGDALRVATGMLGRLETELKMLKLEGRDEMWWRSSGRAPGRGPTSLRRSEQFRSR
jgi:hypothetical protein